MTRMDQNSMSIIGEYPLIQYESGIAGYDCIWSTFLCRHSGPRVLEYGLRTSSWLLDSGWTRPHILLHPRRWSQNSMKWKIYYILVCGLQSNLTPTSSSVREDVAGILWYRRFITRGKLELYFLLQVCEDDHRTMEKSKLLLYWQWL